MNILKFNFFFHVKIRQKSYKKKKKINFYESKFYDSI